MRQCEAETDDFLQAAEPLDTPSASNSPFPASPRTQHISETCPLKSPMVTSRTSSPVARLPVCALSRTRKTADPRASAMSNLELSMD